MEVFLPLEKINREQRLVYGYASTEARDSQGEIWRVPRFAAALAPDPVSHVQTLCGLVLHCWIAGRIQTDEGVLGGQAVAIVPVEILVSG